MCNVICRWMAAAWSHKDSLFALTPPSLFQGMACHFPQNMLVDSSQLPVNKLMEANPVTTCSLRNLVIWRWRRGSSLGFFFFCHVFSVNTGATISFQLTGKGWIWVQSGWCQASSLNICLFLLQARLKEVKRGGPRQEWVRKIVRNDEESLKESGDSGGIWRYRWALLSPAEQHINWHESAFHFNWGTLTRDALPCSKSHCSFIQVLQKCKDNKHFVGSIRGGPLASSFYFILL